MRKPISFYRGITLIEILVVFSIMTLISLAVIPQISVTLNGFSTLQDLNKFQNFLFLARSPAITTLSDTAFVIECSTNIINSSSTSLIISKALNGGGNFIYAQSGCILAVVDIGHYPAYIIRQDVFNMKVESSTDVFRFTRWGTSGFRSPPTHGTGHAPLKNIEDSFCAVPGCFYNSRYSSNNASAQLASWEYIRIYDRIYNNCAEALNSGSCYQAVISLATVSFCLMADNSWSYFC